MKKEADKTKARIKPMPNTIVSCRKDGHDNALAIGFISNIATDPLMIMVAIRPSRYSHEIIKETKNFVVNLPTKDFKREFDYLGSVSGYDEDKLTSINTTDADVINAPILTDCPVNIECSVVDSIQPGSHELFIGKVEKVHCDEEYLTEDNDVKWDEIDLI